MILSSSFFKELKIWKKCCVIFRTRPAFCYVLKTNETKIKLGLASVCVDGVFSLIGNKKPYFLNKETYFIPLFIELNMPHSLA